MKSSRTVLISALGFQLSAFSAALGAGTDTIHVDPVCGDNAWSGDSPLCRPPSGPKRTIAAAIGTAQPGDEIVLAPGEYLGAIVLSFPLTLRSVDPTDPATVAATVLNGGGAGPVITCDDLDQDTVISGLTIVNGGAREGGGLLNLSSSPTVVGCVFASCSATDDGGAMKNTAASSPAVIGCVFLENSAPDGGAVASAASSAPLISGCLFIGNSSQFNGGAMANFSSSAPLVVGCLFAGNAAGGAGGAMINVSPPTVVNSTFCANSPDHMLGAFHDGGGNAFEASCEGGPGACCLPGGECLEVGADACAGAGGEFQGELTACLIAGCAPERCPADTNGDGVVNTDDLINVILAWNTADPGADVDGSGNVDVNDLVAVVLAWGRCG